MQGGWEAEIWTSATHSQVTSGKPPPCSSLCPPLQGVTRLLPALSGKAEGGTCSERCFMHLERAPFFCNPVCSTLRILWQDIFSNYGTEIPGSG